MRPFVYHLMENFVDPSWVEGRRVVDFSAGLGDLSRMMAGYHPSHLMATVPDAESPPDEPGVEWRSGVLASRISDALAPGSVDLFCARMVFQFPRFEDGGVDVDTMLAQIAPVLAPGGRIVIATHAFFPLQTYPSLKNERDSDALVAQIRRLAASAPGDVHEILTTEARRIAGLAELVQYLGLPPRESETGVTGYGLRVPALIGSFLRAGLALEIVDDVEPFTYPLEVWSRFATEPDLIAEWGAQVLAIKRRHLLDPAAADIYSRPAVVGDMLSEIRSIVDVVTVPIVRVVARKTA